MIDRRKIPPFDLERRSIPNNPNDGEINSHDNGQRTRCHKHRKHGNVAYPLIALPTTSTRKITVTASSTMNSVPPTLFASSPACLRTAPLVKGDPRIKPMKTHSADRERQRRPEKERERSTLTAYSPLRTSPARKDKCSRLAIYLNSRSRRGNTTGVCSSFLPPQPSPLPGGKGGGNFTKEDDYRGTRGERGDAVKGRFCQPRATECIVGCVPFSRACARANQPTVSPSFWRSIRTFELLRKAKRKVNY